MPSIITNKDLEVLKNAAHAIFDTYITVLVCVPLDDPDVFEDPQSYFPFFDFEAEASYAVYSSETQEYPEHFAVVSLETIFSLN